MNTSVQFAKPSAILHDAIEFYYFLEISTSDISKANLNQWHIHVADGCIEMLIAYKDSTFNIQSENQKLNNHATILFGPRCIDNMTKSTGYTSTFSGSVVKFNFYGFFKIFKLPLSEIYNTTYETDAIFGSKMLRLIDKLESAGSNSERINHLNRFFTKQLEGNSFSNLVIDRCKEAYSLINQYKGNIHLPKILEHLGICERTLERNFKTVAGFAPKDLCRIVRLNNVIEKLYNQNDVEWPKIVYDNGYYDQAHMIKEFKKATLVTPEWFFKNKDYKIFKNHNQLIFPVEKQLSKIQYENIINTTKDGYKTFLEEEAQFKTPL